MRAFHCSCSISYSLNVLVLKKCTERVLKTVQKTVQNEAYTDHMDYNWCFKRYIMQIVFSKIVESFTAL